MKKLLMSLSVVALLAGMSGCSKDDPAPSKVCSARIDGDLFEASLIEGSYDADNNVTVEGYEGASQGFTFTFNLDEVEEGETYDIENFEFGAGFLSDDGEFFLAVSGEVHVTKVNNTRFEATFEFTGEGFGGGDIEVTDGVIKTDLVEE